MYIGSSFDVVKKTLRALEEYQSKVKELEPLEERLRLLEGNMNIKQAREYYSERFPDNMEKSQKFFDLWLERQSRRLEFPIPEEPKKIIFEYVYGLYDSEAKLVYIGVTNNPTERLKQHKRQKNFTELKILEQFVERAEAEQKEKELIKKHNPKLNIVGKTK